MQLIEKVISPLIENQFPDFYKEEGQLFIAFVKAYYEWLETYTQLLVLQNPEGFNVGDEVQQLDVRGKIISKTDNKIIVELLNFDSFRCNINCDTLNPLVSSSGASSFISSNINFSPLFWARHLPEIRDIDKTLDRFILQFKNKYLPNIQFVTATNKELFIKNALDFYRAKGTERAVDLFFKLVYGFGARIYYPGSDLFKPSDNDWADIKYLEIGYADTNVNFVGQVIYGMNSGAEAFAENLVRIKKDTRFINVLYITNLKGDFRTGEQIRTRGLDEDVTTKVVGSLSRIDILPSSPGFVVGEDLIILEGAGKGAKVRVTETEDFVGAIDFQLLEGGWGYSGKADIIGSDRTLILDEYTVSNTEYYFHNDTFKQFQRIYQDLASFKVDASADAFFPVPFEVMCYDSTDTLVLEGTAVSYDITTERLVINYDKDDYGNADLIVTAESLEFSDGESNVQINVSSNDSYTFVVSANVIACDETYTYTYVMDNANPVTPATRLRVGDILSQNVVLNGVEQQFANAVVIQSSANSQLGEFYVTVNKGYGLFREGNSFKPIERMSTGDKYRIVNVSNTNIGVISVTGTSPTSIENEIQTDGYVYGISPYWDESEGDIVYAEDGTRAKVIGNFTGNTPKATFEITETSDQFFVENFSSNVQLIYSGANLVSFILEATPTLVINSVSIDLTNAEALPIDVFSSNSSVFEGTAISYNDSTKRLLITYNNNTYSNSDFIQSLDELTFDDDANTTSNVANVDFEFSTILNTVIGSAEYGILPSPSLGYEDTIKIVGDFSDDTIASISRIVPLDAGSGYPIDPFYVVYEPNAFHFEQYDVQINYIGDNKNFAEGETIDVFDFDGANTTPTDPPEKYRIYRHDRSNKVIEATRLKLDDDLWISNAVRKGQLIQGETSGVTAEVLYVKELRRRPRVGLNSNIQSTAFSGSGIVRSVSIVSSGFGYFDDERLLFVSESDPNKQMPGIGKLSKQGIGEGFFRNRKSFLSSDKYLQDNDFYQEYSYQVLTALPFSTYKQTLIDVLHVAGTKPFGVYVATINNSLEISSDSTTVQSNT